MFARRYGQKLSTYARFWEATRQEGDVLRTDPTNVHQVLHWWLSQKLSERAPFGWEDFTMAHSEMDIVVNAACDNWLKRYDA